MGVNTSTPKSAKDMRKVARIASPKIMRHLSISSRGSFNDDDNKSIGSVDSGDLPMKDRTKGGNIQLGNVKGGFAFSVEAEEEKMDIDQAPHIPEGLGLPGRRRKDSDQNISNSSSRLLPNYKSHSKERASSSTNLTVDVKKKSAFSRLKKKNTSHHSSSERSVAVSSSGDFDDDMQDDMATSPGPTTMPEVCEKFQLDNEEEKQTFLQGEVKLKTKNGHGRVYWC